MTNKEAIEILKEYKQRLDVSCSNQLDADKEAFDLAIRALEERPQGEWFDCIKAGILKARHGNYVLYKVDFLLDNLTREIYIMEGARRMRGKNK